MISKGNYCCAHVGSVRCYDLLIIVIPNNDSLIGQYPILMLHIFFYSLLMFFVLVGPIFSYNLFFPENFSPGKKPINIQSRTTKKYKFQIKPTTHSTQRRTLFSIDS